MEFCTNGHLSILYGAEEDKPGRFDGCAAALRAVADDNSELEQTAAHRGTLQKTITPPPPSPPPQNPHTGI